MFNRKTLLNRLGAHTTNSLTSTAWGSIPGGMVCGHRVKRECFLRIPRFLPTVTPQKPLRSVPSGDLLYIYIYLWPLFAGPLSLFAGADASVLRQPEQTSSNTAASYIQRHPGQPNHDTGQRCGNYTFFTMTCLSTSGTY